MSQTPSIFTVPGMYITSTEEGFLRGHGTQLVKKSHGTENTSSSLVSTMAGIVNRMNKLVSVHPTKRRFVGEVGDLVVGRVISVESKRWKVDIGGSKDAIMHLNAVYLPGGQQRTRTYEDQLQMRQLYKEADLISAEIQNIGNQDGTISLHTRSL